MSAFSHLSEELRYRIANYFDSSSGLKNKELTLTAIQEKAIPEILEGKNCILSAQTAGGKTEAAFWPLLDLIRQERGNTSSVSVNCVYLSPLTALLNNIEPRISDYADFISARAFKWHGGISRSNRKKAIENPPEILLTTPESLEVILDSETYAHSIFFEGLQFIVIDEVHYFVESERGDQLVSLLERMSRLCGNDLQRVGLSATVGNPQEVLKWFCGSSKREEMGIGVQGEDDKEKEIRLEHYPINKKSLKEINDRIFAHVTEGHLKKSILFTKSRQKAEQFGSSLENRLKNEKLGDRLHVHHGSVSQDLREEAERLINLESQKGKRCIVSTSTLELGIDIGGLETVIQAGEFSSVSSYLQRLGRTGREEKIPQNLLSLTTNPFDFLKNLAILELGGKGDVESYWPTKRNYSLLFQQLFGAIRSHSGVQFDEFWKTVRHAYPFEHITKEEAKLIVKHAFEKDYFTKADSLLLVGEKGEEEFSSQHWLKIYSTFETPPAVRVIKDNQEIGTLDAWWVFNKKLPYVFLLGGKKLKAIELDKDHGVLYVKNAPAAEPPAWASSGALTSKLVAQQMRRILVSNRLPINIKSHVESKRCLENLRESINTELLGKEGLGFEFVESSYSKAFVHTFAGNQLNRTLNLLFEQYTDFEIEEVNALSFVLKSERLSKKELVTELEEILLAFSEGKLFNIEKPEVAFSELDIDAETLTKFSKYLPESLQRKQYFNTLYDFHGLQKWLIKIKNDSERRFLAETGATGLPKLVEHSLGI